MSIGVYCDLFPPSRSHKPQTKFNQLENPVTHLNTGINMKAQIQLHEKIARNIAQEKQFKPAYSPTSKKRDFQPSKVLYSGGDFGTLYQQLRNNREYFGVNSQRHPSAALVCPSNQYMEPLQLGNPRSREHT